MATTQTTYQIQAVGGTVGGTAESARSGELPISHTDLMTLYLDYTAGTEGTVYVYPKFRHTSGGTLFPWNDFGTVIGDQTPTAKRIKLTSSGKFSYQIDVRGHNFVTFFSQTVGAPTGALGLMVTEVATL